MMILHSLLHLKYCVMAVKSGRVLGPLLDLLLQDSFTGPELFECTQGLYRSAGQKKQADFFARDFSSPAQREAACKNAFVLLAQHRAELAASFFILGEHDIILSQSAWVSWKGPPEQHKS